MNAEVQIEWQVQHLDRVGWRPHHGGPDEAEQRQIMARWQLKYPDSDYRLVRVITVIEVVEGAS